MTSSASAVRMRSAHERAGSRSPTCPGTAAWSLGITSPRRQAATTGTWRSSANRTRSLEQRARRTPAPARITGRSAEARRCSTARTSPTAGRLGVRPHDRDARALGDREVEDVLGQGDQRGTGPALDRGADGGLERRLGGRRVVDLARPLGEPPDGVDEVDLLERLASPDRAVDLADEHEHRRRVRGRRVDADGEVGRADGARPEARRRPAGELPVGLGRERGAALVARGHDPDPGRLERVQDRQEALARHGERDPDAGRAQRGGDQLRDRRRRRRLRGGPRRRSARDGVGSSASSAASARRSSASRSSSAARRGSSCLGVPSSASRARRPRVAGGLDRRSRPHRRRARPRRLIGRAARRRRRLGLGRAASSAHRRSPRPPVGDLGLIGHLGLGNERLVERLHRDLLSAGLGGGPSGAGACGMKGRYRPAGMAAVSSIAASMPATTTTATMTMRTLAVRPDPGIAPATGSSRTGGGPPGPARAAAR